MKILIIEDDVEKLDEIENHIREKYAENNPKITKSLNLSEACKEIRINSYDLIIFDIYLPDNANSLSGR